MKEQIKKITQKNSEALVGSIQDIVRIPSVRNLEDKADNAAFGREIRRALDAFLELASSMGMRTYADPEGYYGYAEIGPEDAEEMIGIIGHLDVVPAGDEEQWTEAKPFSGDIVDKKIIGRGTLDDKGPTMINLYAMKNLLDLELDLTKRVRIVVGCAEETTWECMDKYVELEEKPTIAYAPDADFPLIYAEKTIVQMDASATCDVDFEVEAMGAYNAVPGVATYKGTKASELAAELDKLGFAYENKDDNTIVVIGQASHSMANQLGTNAVARLAMAMYNIGERTNVIDFIAEQVKETNGGEEFQGKVSEEVSGDLKFTVSRIEIKDGKQYIGMDSRIPVLADVEDIMKKYQTVIEQYGLKYEEVSKQDKLYVEKDSFLVSTLLKVYRDISGEQDAEPLTTGGGTYARAFDNCVAFGCVFQSENMIDKMHQPNECFELKFLNKASEIYTTALIELLK